MKRIHFVCIAAAIAASACLASAQFPGMPMTPAERARLQAQQNATEADHRYMTDVLHLKTLRPGANGLNPKAPNADNTDEAWANPYPNLPNPLVSNSGVPITTPKLWWRLRRPEIVQDFDRDIYGYVPRNVPKVTWILVREVHGRSHGVAIITRHLIGHVDNSIDPAITVNIPLTVTVPAHAGAPVPVLIHFGFNFNPALMKGFLTALKKRGIKVPPPPKGPGWKQQLLEADWGYALLNPTSYQADNGAGLHSGIIGLVNHGRPRRPEEWGALRAWAWGASRALDYLQTDPAVNAKEVGIEGLSRYGKAALVAMAYDQRFAIGLIGSSGKGGATLYRRHFGEEMGNLAGSGEYHWFAGEFMKFDAKLTANDLPVDSHELIAMCAPRPIFISYGSPKIEGGWVDSHGSFMAAVAAGPVYRLLGKRGLGSTKMPPLGVVLLSGDIGWRRSHGGHTDLPNWPAFMKFASKYIHPPPSRK
jgi:hypothetical protein